MSVTATLLHSRPQHEIAKLRRCPAVGHATLSDRGNYPFSKINRIRLSPSHPCLPPSQPAC
jgi:hypothetical protein